MYQFESLQKIVGQQLEAEFANPGNHPDALYEPIRYIIKAGGKRLRPALVLAGCNLFADNILTAIYPAVAVEVFHNFTLMHDDIMDQSALRRGIPTVHKKWNINRAILSGDAMQILAYEYLAKCESQHLGRILHMFTKTAKEVCEGQQYDMDFETMNNVTVEQYLRMIELKTSVLLAGSLHIGAIIGGANESDALLLYEFGKYIGLAFQLQDDYLDVYGDPAIFGKSVGNDIVANKKTYLLIKALELADKQTYNELSQYISCSTIDANEKIRAVTDIYNRLNVNKYSQQKMIEYHDAANTALQNIRVDEERKQPLRDFAHAMLKRLW